ncbi:hypothetical protein [Variovorax paradoxus]|uniref:hypothetical protein n=1 Tax=Variovorax paradoxus TaxID=34073 RepID=UPI00193196D4|nr:hypothetical protein INQ48_43575 [Variovorax paradoxus]
MNYSHDHLFPIGACIRKIAQRWDSLMTNVPFAALEAHVRDHRPTPHDLDAYQPSFGIPPTAAGHWDRYAKVAKRGQIAALEIATAHCVAARVGVPKSLAGLLAAADTGCRTFDHLRVAEQHAIDKRHADRVKGGKTRQDRLRPAREYAFKLFRSMCPAGGWKDAAHAARTIYPKVKEFVWSSRLPMLAEDSLIRTIRGWLKKAFYAQG